MEARKCLNCNKDTKNPKFCSKSCSATYNNKKRGKRREETKRKISETLLKYYDGKDIVKKKIGEKRKRRISKSVKKSWNNRKRYKYKYCKVCNKKLPWGNKYGYCKKHWLLSNEFQKVVAHGNKNYRKGYVYNKWTDRYEYLMSSLEFNYYDYLTENNIKWDKPKPLKYILDEKEHLYFPDFYLSDSDEYIEIKGYMWNKDKEKMKCVIEQHKDKTFIIMDKKKFEKVITSEFIKKVNEEYKKAINSKTEFAKYIFIKN